MMGRGLMLVLVLLPLWVAGARAEPLDAKISIHVSDTLENIVQLLREEHSLFVSAEGQLHQRFLDLDVEEGAPRDVIIAICKALGAVYDQNAPSMTASGARPHDPCSWSLRVGEWDSAARPQATVGNYTLYVEAVEQYRSDSIGFRWGMEAPEVKAIARVSIRLRVEPHTAGAPARMLAGFWPEATALTDRDELVTTTHRVPDDWTTRPGRVFPSGNRYERVLELAPFPEGTTRLNELRGKLALFREATPLYCAFTADEVGTTKKLADVDCKLLEWKVPEESVAVTWERASARPDLVAESPLRATMLAEDGTVLGAHGRGRGGRPNKGRETYRFPVAQGNELRFVMQGFLRRDPQRLLDCSIPDIRRL